jgi:hypothetical protein
MDRNSYSPLEFAKRNGVSLTKVYKEIAAGRLDARKSGRRTIITAAAEQRWADALPKIQPTAA